jgi:hypothetical protein
MPRPATGILERWHPNEEDPYLVFRYRVVRLWQEPVERFLTGGLGTLPLAALTDEAKDHLLDLVSRIDARLEEEASPALAERLRAATFLLLGLRYEAEKIPDALRRIEHVEDSSTYQLIIRRGCIADARDSVLDMGAIKFGQPADAATQSQIESITDLERLIALRRRLLFVTSWSDLLAGN